MNLVKKRKIILFLYWLQLSLSLISIILSIIPLVYNVFKNGNYINLLNNWKKHPISSLSISNSSQQSEIYLNYLQLSSNQKLYLNGWSSHYFLIFNNENKHIDYKYILNNLKDIINLLKKKTSLIIDNEDISSIFNKKNYQLNSELLNTILQSSNYKICGTDLIGNFIIYKKNDPCPINYIYISEEEPNVNFTYNSIEINKYKKLYYSNLNTFGNIITELKINNIEICANIFKSDNFKILINTYYINNKMCEDGNIDPSYIYLDSDSILTFFETNEINLEENEYIPNGKINLYYRTYYGITNFNDNILSKNMINLMFNSKKIFNLLIIIRIVLSNVIFILLFLLIVSYIQFINHFGIYSNYCIIGLLNVLIVIKIILSIYICYIFYITKKIIKKVMFNKILLKEFSNKNYIIIDVTLIITYISQLILEIIKIIIKRIKSKSILQGTITKSISKINGLTTNVAIGDSQMPIDVNNNNITKINNFFNTKLSTNEKK